MVYYNFLRSNKPEITFALPVLGNVIYALILKYLLDAVCRCYCKSPTFYIRLFTFGTGLETLNTAQAFFMIHGNY